MRNQQTNQDLDNISSTAISLEDKYEDLALNHRKIFINDEITNATIFNAIYYVHKLLDQDEKQGFREPIDIYINTVGGVCSEGFILVDLIEQLKKNGYEVNTIVTGTAYSFGVILALMGTRRYCYRHCDFMCHTISIFTAPAPLPDLKKTVQHSERIEKMVKEYILNNSSISESLLNEKIDNGKDWYFGAEEAVEYGICQKIL